MSALLRPLVFLGPSLSVGDARAILPDADYTGPARAGDIWRAVYEDRRRRIVLIDGVFGSVPSVWHKEILFALDQGASVVGGGSMGALRAAECEAFGMVGVGQVFHGYRSGELLDDADVALVHLPSSGGYRALTVPLVTVRYGLADAAEQGLLGVPEIADHLAQAAAIHFFDRTTACLRAAWGEGPRAATLVTHVVRHDVKRRDAVAVLQKAAAGEWPCVEVGSIGVEPTRFFDRLLLQTLHPEAPPTDRDARVQRSYEVVRGRLLAPGDPTTGEQRRLFARLVWIVSDAMGITASLTEVAGAAEEVRARLGLWDADATRAWLARRGITARQWHAQLGFQIRVEKLIEQLAPDLRAQVPLLLTLADAWGEPEATPPPAEGESDDSAWLFEALQRRGLWDAVGVDTLDALLTRLGFSSPGELAQALTPRGAGDE